MVDRTALDNAKPALRSYLLSIGLDPDNPMRCLFHHPDNHPSMSFIARTNTVFCHACHKTADIVNVIAAVEGLAENSRAAIERAIEYAGTAPITNGTARKPTIRNASQTTQRARWIAATQSNAAMDYLRLRGFTDDDTVIIENYHLEYDPVINCLIIPHDKGYYTARKIDAVDKADRYRFNPKHAVELFNSAALDEPVAAVTEGAIDALSLIAIGIPAVALGGATTQKKLLQAMLERANRPNIIICFDNDDAGRKAATDLGRKIKAECGVKVKVVIPKEAHDINEAFQETREQLTEYLHQVRFALMPEIPIDDPIEADDDTEPTHPPQPTSKPPIATDDYSDFGIADAIIKALPNDIRYNYDGGKFMYYRAPIWLTFNKDGELRTIVNRYKQEYAIGDKRLTTMLNNDSKVKRVISMFRSFDNIRITAEDLNNHPNLLNVGNGVLNLDDGKLYPHDGKYYFTRQAPVIYDPKATCPVFDKFLTEIIPDEPTRNAVITYLGYSLSGYINAEKALFVHGSGGNGKGTLFRTVMHLMGNFATPFKIDALLASSRQQDSQSATPEFNKLEYARLAIAEEIPKTRKLDAAQFKLLTGGDYLPIRRLYQEATMIKNVTHKLILCGNALPELSDPDDGGLKRRLMVVEFPKSFTDKDCDPTLKQRLTAPAEQSGILNRLLDGYHQWALNGLTTSKLMDDERQQYLTDNDQKSTFIEDYIIVDPDAVTTRKEMLAFIKRTAPYDIRRLQDRELIEMLTAIKGVEYRREKRGFVFVGITPNDDPDDQ